MSCSICIGQVPPRKYGRDRAGYAAATRQHKLDHTAKEDIIYLPSLADLVHGMGIDYLSEVWIAHATRMSCSPLHWNLTLKAFPPNLAAQPAVACVVGLEVVIFSYCPSGVLKGHPPSCWTLVLLLPLPGLAFADQVGIHRPCFVDLECMPGLFGRFSLRSLTLVDFRHGSHRGTWAIHPWFSSCSGKPALLALIGVRNWKHHPFTWHPALFFVAVVVVVFMLHFFLSPFAPEFPEGLLVEVFTFYTRYLVWHINISTIVSRKRGNCWCIMSRWYSVIGYQGMIYHEYNVIWSNSVDFKHPIHIPDVILVSHITWHDVIYHEYNVMWTWCDTKRWRLTHETVKLGWCQAPNPYIILVSHITWYDMIYREYHVIWCITYQSHIMFFSDVISHII